MKIGNIEIEGDGLTNGHPPVIIAGKIKAGTECKTNGLLMLNEDGEFEPYNFETTSGAASVALEPITAGTTNAKILLHGTFDGGMVAKADGVALTANELVAVQANSQIYFI